jgi:hypothetical protein
VTQGRDLTRRRPRAVATCNSCCCCWRRPARSVFCLGFLSFRSDRSESVSCDGEGTLAARLLRHRSRGSASRPRRRIPLPAYSNDADDNGRKLPSGDVQLSIAAAARAPLPTPEAVWPKAADVRRLDGPRSVVVGVTTVVKIQQGFGGDAAELTASPNEARRQLQDAAAADTYRNLIDVDSLSSSFRSSNRCERLSSGIGICAVGQVAESPNEFLQTTGQTSTNDEGDDNNNNNNNNNNDDKMRRQMNNGESVNRQRARDDDVDVHRLFAVELPERSANRQREPKAVGTRTLSNTPRVSVDPRLNNALHSDRRRAPRVEPPQPPTTPFVYVPRGSVALFSHLSGMRSSNNRTVIPRL